MRPAFTESAAAVTVAPKRAPGESWIRRLWPSRRARPEKDKVHPPQPSLLAFAAEEPARRVQGGAVAQERDLRQLAPRWRRLTHAQAATAAVVLVAIAQGTLIAVWLQSRGVAGLRPTGVLTINSEPAGAPVSVDGVRHGVTPSALSLSAGEHRIDIGEGAMLRSRTVSMTNGREVFVHLELPLGVPQTSASPVIGGLQITTDPSGAQVSVDGQARGAAPLSVTDLPPGPHTVTVSGPKGRVTRQVTVEPGTVSSLVISMSGTAEFASGWLAISSPIPVQIFEGESVVGNTDMKRVLLSAGRHDLELTNPGLGYRARRTVEIAAGRTTSLTLQVPSGMLHINALPWAVVSIGTRQLGETPIANVSLPLGTHELVFRHPELGEQRKTVVVGVGAAVRVGVDLRKGQP